VKKANKMERNRCSKAIFFSVLLAIH